MTKNYLTLIGMPVSSKGSVGVILARKADRHFIDGDLLTQEQSEKLSEDLIAEHGGDGLRALEDETLAAFETENAVTAPDGSVIYGEKAMTRLKALGKVIYLKPSYPAIQRRFGDLTTHGVNIREGQTLRDFYWEHTVLYEKYADLVIDENGLSIRKAAEIIARATGEDSDLSMPPEPKKQWRRKRRNDGEGGVA